MITLELPGKITENGKLEVELPPGLPAGDITVKIEVPDAVLDWEHQPWTDEEIRKMMTPRHKSFNELVEWLDANPLTKPWGGLRDDEDAAEYIHRMRHQPSFVLDDPL